MHSPKYAAYYHAVPTHRLQKGAVIYLIGLKPSVAHSTEEGTSNQVGNDHLSHHLKFRILVLGISIHNYPWCSAVTQDIEKNEVFHFLSLIEDT
jgi:hypothetical protein